VQLAHRARKEIQVRKDLKDLKEILERKGLKEQQVLKALKEILERGVRKGHRGRKDQRDRIIGVRL
jgi:hypothetical protein